MTDTMSQVREALAERLVRHVERLANTAMDLSMSEWNEISNHILDAANMIRHPAPDVPGAEEIEAIRARHEADNGFESDGMDNAEWRAALTMLATRAHADRATLLRLLDAARAELTAERLRR